MTEENTFSRFALDEPILRALKDMNFEKPSPIQEKTLPVIMDGSDVIALAETGSGKTAACAIPICQKVQAEKKHIQALVLVPTRELALQYATETQKVGKYKGLSTLAVYGGADADVQQAKLKHMVHICVATPGRLIDFIYSRQLDLSHVEILVLDEADEMMSMGFIDDLNFIIACLIHEHQTLLFSATMPEPIRKLAKDYMREPQEVILNKSRQQPKTIEHIFSYCRSRRDKDHLLKEFLEDEGLSQALIFCSSRLQCEDLAAALKPKFTSSVDFLHGGLAQNIRSIVISKFRQKKIRYLVTSDIAARGLDFSKVSHVIMYQLPRDAQTYLHRSGRTGRFGASGKSMALISDKDLKVAREIEKILGKSLTWIKKPAPRKKAPVKSYQRKPKRG